MRRLPSELLAPLCAPMLGAKAQEAKTEDLIVIVKSARTMTLRRHGEILKMYKVALGGQPGRNGSPSHLMV
jgi:hypothetical protein